MASEKNDIQFFNRINNDLAYCSFHDELINGFMFFMGLSMNININKSPIDLRPFFNTEENQINNFNRLINLYSTPETDFDNYGDLNDYYFQLPIYTYNVLLVEKILNTGTKVEDELRKIKLKSGNSYTILKSELDTDFINKFSNCDFTLLNTHEINKYFFKSIGKHLIDKGYDKQKSYEAGYAYSNMMLNMDIKGTTYLIANIYQFLTPIFKAFIQYPILYAFYPRSLAGNHIFSSTLQMFYLSIDPSVVRHIHYFHQIIFYDETSKLFRDDWDFSKNDRSVLLAQLIFNVSKIRETNIIQYQKDFLEFEDYYLPELKNKIITKSQLIASIEKVMLGKYNITSKQIVNSDNTGDFIQLLAIVFYETCLHSMILKDLLE